MADNRLQELKRRWTSSGSYENLSRYMAELDRTGTRYVTEVQPVDGRDGWRQTSLGSYEFISSTHPRREGQWHQTPIASFEFGTCSSDSLTWPDAWTFVKEQGGLLQSLAEAVTRRVAFYKDNQTRERDVDHSDKYQLTRTLNLKFYENGIFYSAFAELPDEDTSLELLTQGYDETRAGLDVLRRCDDPLIAELLQQARDLKRIRPVQNETEIKLSTQQNGSSEYGRNADKIAVFGSHVIAELNAWYLQQQDKTIGYLWAPKDYIKEALEDKKDHVLLRLVSLGGLGYVQSEHIYFDYHISTFVSSGGRACAVTQKAKSTFS